MSMRYLYVDMNSYFASVEQQLRPELRGRPVAVIPVRAETTCCIAASYEAKRLGVKTGTIVAEARRLCPGLRLVPARPREYIQMHHRIVQAVDACVPVQAVLSIDEMVCRLAGRDREEAGALHLAERVKAAIYRNAGEWMRCSIGLGPNRMLAKVAADMQKPNGLTVIRRHELPQRLYALKLQDFPGIGPRMDKRLLSWGITTVQQLCDCSAHKLCQIWGSKLLGQSWWHRLRGEDVAESPTHRSTISHSRVLPPAWRDERGARDIALRLTEKIAARLRYIQHWAGTLTLAVDFGARSWQARSPLSLCQDTSTLLAVVDELWRHKPEGWPLKVTVVLSDLVTDHNATPSLFATDRNLTALSRAMDQINQRLGSHTLYFAALHGVRDEVGTSIAFTQIPDLDLADA